jgi:CMP-N-acetylneuraminic acid synthetase
MRVVVLMPMKGNSERVKNKNMREFADRPLYHAVISEIRRSKFTPLVAVNTDNQIIKDDIYENFPDVRVINRPDHLVGDFVPMNDIIGYDITQVNGDIYIQTHSTNPLMLASTLDSAITKFIEHKSEYDSVFSVTKLQTRLYWEDGEPINHNPAELIRTQDLPPVFEENSNFFIFTKTSFEMLRR